MESNGKLNNFYDADYYREFVKIHTFTRSYFVDNSPRFLLSQESRTVQIQNKSLFYDENLKTRLRNKLDRKLLRIEKLRSKLKSETNELVKNFYLDRLIEEEGFTNLCLLKTNDNFDNEIHFHEICKINLKPKDEDINKFVNEFIFFINNLDSSNNEAKAIAQDLNEIITSKFDYKKPEIPSQFLISNKDLSENINRILNKKEFIELLENKFKELNFQGIAKYKFSKRHIFSVSTISKQLNIPTKLKITYKKALEILEHELEVHMVRAINGEIFRDRNGCGYKLLQLNSKYSLPIEEGLAIFKEQNLFYKSNKYDFAQLYRYYARVIGIWLAKNFEPYDVYENLVKVFTLQKILFEPSVDAEVQAKILCKRIFAGFPYPEKGFYNPLVSVYLIGNREVWEMHEKGFDLEKLMIGKVTPEELKLINS